MIHLLDCYAYTNRWRVRHPVEKVIFAAGMLMLCMLLPLSGSLIVLAVISAAVLLGARIPLKIYLKVMAVPAAFIALGSLSLLFSISTADSHFHVVYAGDQMPRMIALIARAMAAASCLCFLGLTTPASDWFPMLRKLHVPQVIVDIMFLVHRFLFIFVDRLETMHMAHESRLGYMNMRSTLRSSGMIGANLLVSALKRARSMEMGMASRCFTGEMPILPFEQKPSKTVLFIIALVWLAIGAASVLLK